MKYTVDQPKIRLDVFLADKLAVSRSNVKTVVERNGAFVNGVNRQKSGFELKVGDVVEFELPEPETLDVKAENIPLDIVYQDEWFAVINKPKGMVVHQAASYKKSDTLVNALLFNLDNLSGINGVIRPGIVHRLDKDTSGLLVVAKNDEAHKSLAAQIEKKTAKRIYFGLCDGNFKEDEGTVDAPIARSKKDRKKMAIVEGGRRAVTHYKVLERFGAYTLVRFELETGRTHQIRVHAASLHHAIVGDSVYGGSTKLFDNGQL
ncbi:MAG: RluA family pseudouridine synthase, partial [Clostridia bacterium]|nr:RluA family pseudouridine synthase [Clostridia bacterium]